MAMRTHMETDGARLGDTALLRLLQLASPALPIGAFAYSQGLEQAVELDFIKSAKTTEAWILGLLEGPVGHVDAPIFLRLHAAWTAKDHATVAKWSRYLVAFRETAELRAEERHLGAGLARVLASLGVVEAEPWIGRVDATYAALFALGAVEYGAPADAALQALLFAWTEAQVGAAARVLPLGQTASQRILSAAIGVIPRVVIAACALGDDELGFLAQGQALASALHETQYSRLFRS
jgi:urease accessory protein